MDVETGDATDQPEDVPERPRIRVRPADFIVPPDDPFKNDLLMRREPIEVLTHLLKSIEGPCTLAIDSPWGTGKTSFIEMWSAYLRREGFTVAAFNAWETDFAGEPFAALTAELTEALDPGPNSALAKTIKSTKDAALKVLKHAVPGAIRVATAGILDLSPLLEEEIAEALANSAEESLQKYHDGKDSITDFRAKLAELASCVAEETEGLPLVIIADELDRCRPLYAVELLESAKHLFCVDGVIFVFAVDRTELAHSVRAIYGSEFDAIGYLRRFFDVDYTLPTPERSNFIEALIRSSQIPEYFGRTLDPHGKKEQGFILRMTSKMLGGSSVGLRDIAQGIHRLGLVLGSLPDDKRSFALTASVLVVLRTLQPAAYQEVVAGKRSAAKILDAIFSGPALAELRPTQLGRLFEATLIGGVLEAHGQSETYSELKALSEQMVPKDEPVPEQVEHARAVVHLISELHDSFFGGGIGFKFSVERLELLSAELKPVSE